MTAELVAKLFNLKYRNFQDEASVFVSEITGKKGFIIVASNVKIGLIFESFAFPLDGSVSSTFGGAIPVDLISKHDFHVIIGAVDDYEGREVLLKVAFTIMRVTAIICENLKSLAVVWLDSQTLTEAKIFGRAAEAASGQHIPLTVLVRFGMVQEMRGDIILLGGFSVGLTRFIGQDIEFEPQSHALADVLDSMGMVANCLLQGLVIEDGHTYGRSEQEAVRVRYAKKGRFTSKAVVKCEIERLDHSLRMLVQ